MSYEWMCRDLAAAEASREFVAKDIGKEFYVQQRHKLAQWQPGEEPPDGLVLGELPKVYNRGQGIRVDRGED